MHRRNFLINAGLTLAATVAAGGQTRRAADAAAVDHPPRPLDWSAVRAEFDTLAPDYIHLSSFFLAAHPRPVREAIERHRRAIDENPFVYVEEHIYTMPAEVQAAAAAYLGGRPEEVALTNSTTMGLAFVYHGLPLAAGQEILTTAHDHFVHHEAIRLAAARAGASRRKIALYEAGREIAEDDVVARVRRGIGPKTRVVGLTWVHSGTGVKLPVRRIAEAVAEINRGRAEADRIFLVVDGVHGFGVEDETVAAMGADFFVAGTHKWMFGPRGTGLVWATAANWKALRPTFPAFAPETLGAWMSETEPQAAMQASWIMPGGFHAFEYAWALPAAFEFHGRIGRARVAARIHELNALCREELAKMPKVRLHTPRDGRLAAGIVCFDVEGMKAAEVVKRLHEKRIVASVSPYRDSCARVAPSLLNMPAEIETALRQIRALG